MRRTSLSVLAVLIVALAGCEYLSPSGVGEGNFDQFELDKASGSNAFRGRFKTFEADWEVSHFSEQDCNGRLVAGAKFRAVGDISRVGRNTVAEASYAWDWGTPAGGAYTPTQPRLSTDASASILGETYDFCSDSNASADGNVTLTKTDGRQIHGRIVGGEVYEVSFGNFPGDGQEQFIKVEITGGTDRFEFASGEFVVHNLFNFETHEVVRSEILRAGSRLCIPKIRHLRGSLKDVEPEWEISHFSEQICTSGASAVAGTAGEGDFRLRHLGRTEGYFSAAWDWATPAAGNYTPETPQLPNAASASVLGSYPYDFATNPFATTDPFSPVCGATVSATGEVILESRRGDVFGRITGGEVYEVSFGNFPGDGQEQFVEVEVTGGTGRWEGATGYFVLHTIFNLAEHELEDGEIMNGGRLTESCDDDDDDDDDDD